jgi:hypothetical protein
MKFRIYIAIAAFGMISTSAIAQSRPITVKAGETARIFNFFANCENGKFSGTASGSASNGTITTKVDTGNYCGRANHPVTRVFYTPKPGFKGEDEVFLYAGAGGQQRRTVIVK